MMKLFICLLLMAFGATYSAYGQSADIDSLKAQILLVQTEVEEIQLNMAESQAKFKRGILVATLGYATVITGGLMLGRSRDDLGKGLLIAGGATGVVGTAIMLDAFNNLSKPYKRKKKR